MELGWLSIVPAATAVILCFVTRNTVASLSIACLLGVFIAGEGLMGFPTLLKENIGNVDFAWVMMINMLVGVLVAYFQKSGAIQGMTNYMKKKTLTPKKVQTSAWGLGLLSFFSDSFAPLFVGSTMRGVSDEAKVSREKLAYIADSAAAPVSILVPITAWATFLGTLAVGIGPIETPEQAIDMLIKAIPYNVYAIISVLMVLFVALGIVKDFGPMKKAELRARNEGKVLRDGATPLIGKELTEMQPSSKIKTRIFLNFILPVIVIIAAAFTTYFVTGSAKTLEIFIYVIIAMSISLMIQGLSLTEVIDTFILGVKGAVPALILLGLAYSINGLSRMMGTADFIIDATEGILTPSILPLVIFLVAALMAFGTGSSWGTFSICMPIALPLAFEFSGGEVTSLVLASFAAVAGGGVFGDHCSPLSDTTILASTGAASDHIDHVKTQLPYAFVCAILAAMVYLIIGFVFI